jgi:hypothetical protein
MSTPPDDLKQVLGPNEQVQLYLKQKIYHPTINVDSVVLTNERIILRHPHALGLRKDYTDFNYQDIANVVLKKGLTRSTVECTLRLGGDPLALNDLPNSEAERAYGIIRENLVRFQTPFSAGYAGIPGAPRPPVPQAGMPNPSTARVCSKCGATLVPGQAFCGSCGAPV